MQEKSSGFILSKALELHYIELKKFKPSKPHELRTRFERWLYFLKFSDLYGADEPLPENLAREEGITMALEAMRKAYAKDIVRELIDAREKAERDELSRMVQAREEGREEGRAQGREQGREEGREVERRLTARRLLKLGLDLAAIKQATGLSEMEICKLEPL